MTEKEANDTIKSAMPWARTIAFTKRANGDWEVWIDTQSDGYGVRVRVNGRTLREAVSKADCTWRRAMEAR